MKTFKLLTAFALSVVSLSSATSFAAQPLALGQDDFNSKIESFRPADEIQAELDSEAGATDKGFVAGHHHHRRYYFQCWAKNRRGFLFRGVHNYANVAQNLAIQNCYNAGSRRCFATGCQTVYR